MARPRGSRSSADAHVQEYDRSAVIYKALIGTRVSARRMRDIELDSEGEKYMSKNIAIAIGAAIVGALLVFLYNAIVVAPIPPVQPPLPCNQGTCPIAVSVYGDCSNPNNIVAGPDPAPIDKRNRNPILEWNLPQGGPYTFAANGVDFHGDGQFSNGHAAGPWKYQWNDANSDSAYHKYAINLVNNGAACPTRDPGIINGQ